MTSEATKQTQRAVRNDSNRLPVLTLNLGSTSLKMSLFERMGLGDCDEPLPLVSKTWSAKEPAALLDRIDDEIAAYAPGPGVIVYRIVHGGDLNGPCLLNEPTRVDLAQLTQWAPSHQARSLALAAAALQRWPRAISVAAFDTDWHKTLPALTRTLPLSPELRALGLRRYGFHGLAFQSDWRQLHAELPDAQESRTVLAHLGGGASLCAVLDGCSVDTTMGLTPLDGLPMSNRSGTLDPGIVLHLLRTQSLSPDAIENELSNHSGLLGLSGSTGDMQQLLLSETDEARLAVDIFVHRAAQGIAAMATTLGGIDDLVFSGGIGTHAAKIRSAIAARLAWIGLRLDPSANDQQAMRIEAAESSVRTWVLTAHEDRELARAAAPWCGSVKAT